MWPNTSNAAPRPMKVSTCPYAGFSRYRTSSCGCRLDRTSWHNSLESSLPVLIPVVVRLPADRITPKIQHVRHGAQPRLQKPLDHFRHEPPQPSRLAIRSS